MYNLSLILLSRYKENGSSNSHLRKYIWENKKRKNKIWKGKQKKAKRVRKKVRNNQHQKGEQQLILYGINYCECWCGGEAKEGNRFINGHSNRGRKFSEEFCKKQSELHKGKKQTEESNKKGQKL